MTIENGNTPHHQRNQSAGKNADGLTLQDDAFASVSTFVGSPAYANGVLTLPIPEGAVKARYDFLQQLGLDIQSIGQMADMLVLMEDSQGLEELNIPAIGAGIHALADRSQDYILSGLCEEYSEATDRAKKPSPSLSKANHRAFIDDALEDVVSGKLAIDDPVNQAIMNSRKVESLGKSLVQMSEFNLQNKSAMLEHNLEDLLVMAEMIVTLANETNRLIDQPHLWRASE